MPGCRNCGALIMWVVSRKGKNIPIDHEERLECLFNAARIVRYDPNQMICHWDTCQNIKAHRKNKSKRGKRRLSAYPTDEEKQQKKERENGRRNREKAG